MKNPKHSTSRKDGKGRKLKDGESHRSDGRYDYRYTDKFGKRHCIYAKTLTELREKEKQLIYDECDGIINDEKFNRLTVNELFDRYLRTKQLKDTTRQNYLSTWKNRVQDNIGTLCVKDVRPSDIKMFYKGLSDKGYSTSIIKVIDNILNPCFEMAVEDCIIRKNPTRSVSVSQYGQPPKRRIALTRKQQDNLMEFVKTSSVYNVYLPMLTIFLETGMRVGELIALTWDDVDLKERTINVGKQLIYKNIGDGCKFYFSEPKTSSGNRKIPMTGNVYIAFTEQKKINFLRGINRDIKIEGKSGFIFVTKNGTPIMPNALNNILYNIVKAYNLAEDRVAKARHTQPEYLPRISAHVLRHTACTRFAEQIPDIKVVQYIMGHANADVTLNVYDHITDRKRIEDGLKQIREDPKKRLAN